MVGAYVAPDFYLITDRNQAPLYVVLGQEKAEQVASEIGGYWTSIPMLELIDAEDLMSRVSEDMLKAYGEAMVADVRALAEARSVQARVEKGGLGNIIGEAVAKAAEVFHEQEVRRKRYDDTFTFRNDESEEDGDFSCHFGICSCGCNERLIRVYGPHGPDHNGDGCEHQRLIRVYGPHGPDHNGDGCEHQRLIASVNSRHAERVGAMITHAAFTIVGLELAASAPKHELARWRKELHGVRGQPYNGWTEEAEESEKILAN